jgi:glycosyltransferase involved in cell wall biosynthesis
MGASDQPRVSVVVPCRNEASTIEPLIAAVLRDTAADCEVVVADGGSDDGTRDILARLEPTHARLRIVDNPKQGIPAGLNAAIRAARGRFVVRMDGHTRYAPDYVERCVQTLEQSGADNVGGPQLADIPAQGYVARAIAFAHQCKLSVGGATLHDPLYQGPTDAVAYGCWRRELFDRVGFFNEDLERNEDGEHNHRIIRAGGVIWQTPSIRSWYRPRATLRALFRQYRQYGYWKAFEVRRLRVLRAPRQIVPAAFLVFVAITGLLSLLVPALAAAALLALVAYALFVCYAAMVVILTERQWRSAPVLPLVFAAMQMGYGLGFLDGVRDFWLASREPRVTARELTR